MGHHNIYIISALQRLIFFLSCSPENTKEKLHRGGGHYGDICLITIFSHPVHISQTIVVETVGFSTNTSLVNFQVTKTLPVERVRM